VYVIIQNLLNFIRVKHWIKSFFIFFPIFFAGKINLIYSFDFFYLFFSFCFISSAIYVLNDIIDVDQDKLHPIKKNRPLASGFFSKKLATLLFFFMLLLSILFIDFTNNSYYYVISYFILNLLYSFYLKKIAIIDVSCISIGYVLRVIAGGVAGNVYISHWLIILVFLLTISISFAKRRDDLVLNIEKQNLRIALNGYTIQFLDIVKSISFSMTLISYIFYSISPEVIDRIGTDKLYITSFFVFIGIMRYIQISVVNQKAGSPVDVLYQDRFLQYTLLAWFITFTYILYGKSF
jgi:decaprenyl-phosphate phosphoribosyltransferase